MLTPDTEQQLDELRAEIAKEVGVEIVYGSDESLILHKLPLDIPAIDIAMDGGFAFKRMSMIYGENAAGKTLLALLALRAAQAQGLPTVYIDVERSWEPEWARTVGVDPDRVMVSTPLSGEKAWDVIHAFVSQKIGGVMVVDSLAAMSPGVELDDDVSMEQQFIGVQARMINRGIKTMVAKNTGWVVIVINQLRESVGVRFGSPETLPGGKGQHYYAWQKIRVRRGPWIEEGTGDNKKRVGYQLRIIVEKSKQGAPWKEAVVPFYYTGDIDSLGGLVELALDLGLIEKDGANYTFQEQRWYGRRKLLDAFRGDDELQKLLEQAVETVDKIEL